MLILSVGEYTYAHLHKICILFQGIHEFSCIGKDAFVATGDTDSAQIGI